MKEGMNLHLLNGVNFNGYCWYTLHSNPHTPIDFLYKIKIVYRCTVYNQVSAFSSQQFYGGRSPDFPTSFAISTDYKKKGTSRIFFLDMIIVQMYVYLVPCQSRINVFLLLFKIISFAFLNQELCHVLCEEAKSCLCHFLYSSKELSWRFQQRSF